MIYVLASSTALSLFAGFVLGVRVQCRVDAAEHRHRSGVQQSFEVLGTEYEVYLADQPFKPFI